jgi:hypothetical protein
VNCIGGGLVYTERALQVRDIGVHGRYIAAESRKGTEAPKEHTDSQDRAEPPKSSDQGRENAPIRKILRNGLQSGGGGLLRTSEVEFAL